MSTLTPITPDAAAEALKAAAWTVTSSTDSRHGQAFVHCFTGSVGEDWPLDDALAILPRANVIGWREGVAGHDLAVVMGNGSTVHCFEVRRPAPGEIPVVLPGDEGDPIELPVGTETQRITKALAIATRYGWVDGAHHKMWVIDQMLRALTGCPIGTAHADGNGQPYTYQQQGESQAYRDLRAALIDDDGEEFTVDAWDEGIAP